MKEVRKKEKDKKKDKEKEEKRRRSQQSVFVNNRTEGRCRCYRCRLAVKERKEEGFVKKSKG